MGAPLGNKNSSKENRIFGDELRKAIAQDDRKRIRAGIEKLLDKVAEGDLQAFNAIADRTDGKPKQSVDHGLTDEPENPMHKLVAAADELRKKIRGA